MVIDGTFTFKNWEDHDGHKCVKLDYDGKISGTKSGRMPQIESGKVHGSSWFDPEQGVGIGAESDQTMAFKYDLKGKATSQQVRQNVTIRLVQ